MIEYSMHFLIGSVICIDTLGIERAITLVVHYHLLIASNTMYYKNTASSLTLAIEY